ncbi:hypothetical protein [Caloranaerobacter sp. DY30410]
MKINFEQMAKLYELIKQGVMQKAEGEGFKIYDMKNGTIRIDIKE